MKLPPETVIVALGSNLGDSARQVLEGVRALQNLSILPVRCSSLWQTAPVDCPPGSPLFVNAVVALWPAAGETPASFLEKTQRIEREFGRVPKRVLNEPRPLDLDLIAFGRVEMRTPTLVLPHPRAAERRFVLEPLAELDRDFVIPGKVVTVAAILAGLRVSGDAGAGEGKITAATQHRPTGRRGDHERGEMTSS
jgi:2-amino-4-hydroxy-6-hydroxymethyldihydropteridine diphosphokinase